MAQGKSPFRIVRGVKGSQQVDIETMFKDLRNRSPNIKDLFAVQADVLREYEKNYIKERDVSLELPTGLGKTLVGLLIAEFRRKILGQRVLYLCPTRQLAYQAYRHSIEYDIDARIFVGSKRSYDSSNLLKYRSAKVTAISTYSSLFNASPGINDPQTIILDDAHGAETYISSMWSLTINRQNQSELYSKIIEIFEKDLPPNLVSTIHKSTKSRIPLKTEKVPLGAFHRSLSVLRETLDSAILNLEESDLLSMDGHP